MQASLPLLLFGATSVLGYTFARLFKRFCVPFKSPGNSAISVRSWPSLNLEDLEWVEQVVASYQPATLLYCHAVCDVPKCEAAPDWAYEINVGQLRRVLTALPTHIRFIYVSSDHVFSGNGTYDETSHPCPISTYGRTRVVAEEAVLNRPGSLVIRIGLPVGPSPNGRTGHLDWLHYRTQQKLPITIVEDEYRSAVWARDAAIRVMDLVKSQETGLRHVSATRAVSRTELADYLLKQLALHADYRCESRHQRSAPHLGYVELITKYEDDLATPLPCIIDLPATSCFGEVA